ncbi:fanconi-associated nuclease 1-like isoform X2 [Harmonia axyridis]|uniref:fanconi-associated nuclease 1-like isoform X2 n=1 Tax=Harmonia axyridis TaxID=115357 RepID=UPI001E27638D|nr:fanconi-associated nuclease 1-like isoform X2 [Harmonia axyridis]
MPLKRSKKVETPDGFKQRQITDFFRKSALLSNRNLVPKQLSFYGEKLVDSPCEVYKEQVFMNKSLPSSIFSDRESGNLQASKKRRSRKKLVMTERIEDSLHTICEDPVSMESSSPVPQSLDDDKPKDDQGNCKNIEIKCVTIPFSSTPIPSLNLKLTLNFPKENNLDKSKNKKMRLPYPFSSDDEFETPEKSNKERYNEISSIQETPKSSRNHFQTSASEFGSSSKKRKVESEDHQSHGDHIGLNGSKTASSPDKIEIKKSPMSKGEKESSILFESNETKTQEKCNMKHTEQLKILFEKIMEDELKKKLLADDNMDAIEKFLKMNINYQYLITKMFLYKPIWYNIMNFCSRIKLTEILSAREIQGMYHDQKNDRFIDTDLSHLETKQLLYMLSVEDLKNIVKSLKFGKNKRGSTSKESLIEYLLKNCKTQMTLIKKSSEDLLRDKVFKYLGNCVKLKDDIRTYFDKAYILQTYSNMSYSKDIRVYLEDKCYFDVVYPKYVIDKMTPFKTEEQFSSYYKAFLIWKELDDSKLGNFEIKMLCDEVFRKLESIDEDAKWNRDLPAHLRKFSAEYLYIKILTNSMPKLNEYPLEVHGWLIFLMKTYPTSGLMGLWYKHLTHTKMRNLKKYESAAATVIDGFESLNKNNLNLLQLYELSLLSYKLRTTKVYKLPALYIEKLAALETLIDIDKFPKKFINASTYRSGNKGKRIYSYEDENNEKICTSVENLALKYYKEEEHYDGIICEGRIVSILFNLLFWDIIYESYVEGAFISDLQCAPLDFYSSTFYSNRKDVIDKRLKEIESEWELEKLENTLREIWNNLCQEKSIANSKAILERLVINYKAFHSGLPDLFLWKEDEEGQKVCKFVEVKGENDRLRPNQVLWIDYLLEAGVPVEVCHVSGVGAKKNFLKGVIPKNKLPDDQEEN